MTTMTAWAKDMLHYLTTEYGEFYEYASSINYMTGYRQSFINVYNVAKSMVDDICNIENERLFIAVSKEIKNLEKSLCDIMRLDVYFSEFRAYREAKAQAETPLEPTPPEPELPPEPESPETPPEPTSTSTNDRVAEAVKAIETAKSKDVSDNVVTGKLFQE